MLECKEYVWFKRNPHPQYCGRKANSYVNWFTGEEMVRCGQHTVAKLRKSKVNE